MKIFSMKSKKLVVVSIFIWILIWSILSTIIDNDIYLPKINDVFESLYNIIRDENFIKNVLRTTVSAIFSFTVAIIISVMIGVCASANKYVYNFVYPLVSLLKSIPTIIFILVALIWFKKEYVSLLVGFVIVFPLLYEGVISSILNVDKNLINMAKAYKFNFKVILRNIYMPSILKGISDRSCSSIALVLKLVIASEVYSQPKYGIGALVQSSKMNFNMDEIFAWIIIIILISIFIDIACKAINNYLKRR